MNGAKQRWTAVFDLVNLCESRSLMQGSHCESNFISSQWFSDYCELSYIIYKTELFGSFCVMLPGILMIWGGSPACLPICPNPFHYPVWKTCMVLRCIIYLSKFSVSFTYSRMITSLQKSCQGCKVKLGKLMQKYHSKAYTSVICQFLKL